MNSKKDLNSKVTYGISLNSVIPLRAEADDRSEMVSQILLGERFLCGEHKNHFCKIKNEVDNYSGWIDEKTITEITKEEYVALGKQQTYYVTVPLAEAFDLVEKCVIRIPGGSRLPNCDSIGRFGMHNRKFQVHRDFIISEEEIVKDGLLQTAMSFIHSPYMWGGKTVMGMDCSGFTQIVCGLHGIKLPRDSKDQAKAGKLVQLNDAQPGDLAFFKNAEGNIIHVGILLDKQRIIHASGRVKIDKLDAEGIYSEECQKHTHQLHSVRRV